MTDKQIIDAACMLAEKRLLELIPQDADPLLTALENVRGIRDWLPLIDFDDPELDVSDLLDWATKAKAALDKIPNDLSSDPRDQVGTRPALLTSGASVDRLSKACAEIEKAVAALKARSRE